MNELNNDLNQNQEEIINEISENNSPNYNQVNGEELIKAYIGKNADQLKKGFSWNTIIFGFFYTLYRKMWLVGFCWLLIIVGIKTMPVLLDINLPSMTQLFKNFDWYEWWQITLVLLPYVINIIMAFLFKKIYLRSVIKKVKCIKNENNGKTADELTKICNQKGGTTTLPVIILVLICIGINVYGVYKSEKILDSFEQKAAEDTAYSIISSVELAYAEAFLVTNKDVLVIEDVKKEYSGKGSTWNDNNTITPNNNLYDVVCDISVNSNNEMVVECDVNGKKIKSKLFSLGNKKNNDSENNTNDNIETDKNGEQDNNQVNNNVQNNQTSNNDYTNWINYLLKTDIQEITISRKTAEYDYDLNLTKEELKKSLSKMKDYKLKKAYVTGLGGFQKADLSIAYNIKGKTQHFSIYAGYMVLPANLESGLREALDKSVSEVENEQYKHNGNYTCIYYFEPKVTSVFDEYFDKKDAIDTSNVILNAAELYYAEQVLTYPTEKFKSKVFTFDGNSAYEDLHWLKTIRAVGSVTIDEDGVSHIGTYNANTQEYEGNLVINGYTCKQVQKNNSTQNSLYNVVCEK